MDINLKHQFIISWNKYFPGIELPLAVWYTNSPEGTEQVHPSRDEHCMISQLRNARDGQAICFGKGSIACGGGNRYCGFSQKLRPGFEYFLSYGNESLEGERYKKTPELVTKWLLNTPPFEAPARFLVLKRWDLLTPEDDPFAVIFFSTPDALSGLFTLANYDEEGTFGVVAPMGAGCMSLIQYPYFENHKDNPSAIIGMFDVSARPSIGANELSFTVPMKRFIRMANNMDESFLITSSWQTLQQIANRS